MFYAISLLLGLNIYGDYDANVSDLMAFANFNEFSWFFRKDITDKTFLKNWWHVLAFSKVSLLKLGHFWKNFLFDFKFVKLGHQQSCHSYKIGVGIKFLKN